MFDANAGWESEMELSDAVTIKAFLKAVCRRAACHVYKIISALLQLTIRLADTGGKRRRAFRCARPSSDRFAFQYAAYDPHTKL